MGRYIDADKAKNGVMEFVDEYGEIVGMFVNDFNILLERCAADVVEVVRCKECKYREDEQPSMVYCPNTVGGWVDEDWFCAGGDRE